MSNGAISVQITLLIKFKRKRLQLNKKYHHSLGWHILIPLLSAGGGVLKWWKCTDQRRTVWFHLFWTEKMTQFLRRPPGTYHNFCKEGYHLSPLSQRELKKEGKQWYQTSSLLFPKVLFKKKEEERLLQPFPQTSCDHSRRETVCRRGRVRGRSQDETSRQQVQQLTRPQKELAWGTPRQGPECAAPKRNSCSKGHIGIKPSAGSRGLAKWKGQCPAVPDLKRQVMWGLSEHPLPDIGPMEALGFWHYHQCQKLQERMLKFPSCPIEQRLKIKNILENKVILCCTSEFIVRLLLTIWLPHLQIMDSCDMPPTNPDVNLPLESSASSVIMTGWRFLSSIFCSPF